MRNGGVKYFFAALGILFWFTSIAQQLEPQGKFLDDSVRVGEEIPYAFSLRYPSEMEVLFPDSTYNFFPFELDRKVYFPTTADSVFNVDSVVYYLSTFEIDPVQYLRMPVFVITDGDSTVVFSRPDSVTLVPVITAMPEPPQLKEDTGLAQVKRAFNYPVFLLTLGIVLIAGMLVNVFFGKRIYRAWLIYRLRRRHNRFTKRFFDMIRDVGSNNPSVQLEHVLAVWKQYMEKLEREPFAKMTTREITQMYREPELKKHLRYIDRTIYGHERTSALFNAFDYLLKYSIGRYHKRIEAIRHG